MGAKYFCLFACRGHRGLSRLYRAEHLGAAKRMGHFVGAVGPDLFYLRSWRDDCAFYWDKPDRRLLYPYRHRVGTSIMFAARTLVIQIADAKINAAAHSVEKAARNLMTTGEAFGHSSVLPGQAGGWITLNVICAQAGDPHIW